MNWKKALTELSGTDLRILRDGIRILSKDRTKRHKLALAEQPFDSQLLTASRLFRRSRELYLKQGGRFYPTVVSSPRTLTSPILLKQVIEYTPIERELVWTATDPIESANPKTLTSLLQNRSYCTNLFHEQNHRILWKFLPPPSRVANDVHRYLNAVESLIVAIDMALGDELTHAISRIFYLTGVTYNPGTEIRSERLSKRAYRNYLHASLYATYLKLQLHEPKDIRKAVLHLYPQDKKLTERAIKRALKLDDAFVRITNITWQDKHIEQVIEALAPKSKSATTLVFPKDPIANHVHYLWAERWFDHMGI